MKLTQTTGPTLGGQNQKEERIQPWRLGEGDLKHNKLKQIIMKRQRNTTQRKEQARNTEVQINEEEQTPWKRIPIIDSKNDQNPRKQNGEKCKNQLTKI